MISELLRTAAVVCREVAIDHAPILYAVRSQPVEPADSGWQFLCGAREEDPGEAQVWAVHEVLEYDRSIEPLIEKPPGTVLWRDSASDRWQVGYDEARG
jgi:hypothetical protein